MINEKEQSPKDKIESLILGKFDSSESNRIKYELEYFESNRVFDYILSMYDRVIIQKTHAPGDKNKFNSLICYYLGLTKTKPIKQEIDIDDRRVYARHGFPDVDMDFDYEKRHLVTEYLVNKYGSEYVGNIGMKQTLKAKAALRRAIKILDPANCIVFDKQGNKIKNDEGSMYMFEQQILKTLPERMKNEAVDVTIHEAYKTIPEFRNIIDKYPEVKRVAERLEGSLSATGIHPAGMILSSVPLKLIAPLHRTTGGGTATASQFDMNDVEPLGLIKFDILGLSTKSAIRHSVELIKERHNISLDMSNLKLNDKRVLDLITSGKTDMIFQCEEFGMKQCLQQIGIDTFMDLVVAIAMYRPGPKDYIPEYASRKKSGKVQYGHKLIEGVSKSTYGILCFQEQIMSAFMVLANLTPNDGYYFIKGCSKKNPEIVDKSIKLFITHAIKNGIPKNAIDIFAADMKKFAGYAFNLSHACSYAYEAYKTAFLKEYYSTEYIVSCLSVENKRKEFEYVEKCEFDAKKNFGFTILPVDLNNSKIDYTIVDEKVIRKSLLVKGIGDKAMEEIITNQPYKGPDKLCSFATKTGSSVNLKTMTALIDAGVFQDDPKKRSKSQLLKDFELIRKDKKYRQGKQTDDLFE